MLLLHNYWHSYEAIKIQFIDEIIRTKKQGLFYTFLTLATILFLRPFIMIKILSYVSAPLGRFLHWSHGWST